MKDNRYYCQVDMNSCLFESEYFDMSRLNNKRIGEILNILNWEMNNCAINTWTCDHYFDLKWLRDNFLKFPEESKVLILFFDTEKYFSGVENGRRSRSGRHRSRSGLYEFERDD